MLEVSNSRFVALFACRSFLFNSPTITRGLALSRYSTPDSSRRPKLLIRAIVVDHYTTLNVPREASPNEIKASYHKLARKYHPDVNKTPGSEEKFKEISAAYEVLSDAEKRSSYDYYGSSSSLGNDDDSASFSYSVDPFDILESFLGTSSGFFYRDGFKSSKFRELDIEYRLNLSFEESVLGGNREIQINCYDICDMCRGMGAKDDSSVATCHACQGKGLKMASQRTSMGSFSQVSPCAKCFGKGTIITQHCGKCEGRGKSLSKRNINVVIPPGAYNGAVLKVKGEGNADQNRGISGDLFVIFHVEEKIGIKRVGNNLYSNVTIDYTHAILGAAVKVETVYGLEDVSIPCGTQHGDVVKIRNMGISDFKCSSIRGDHYFTVHIRIPQSISERERKLLEEIALLKGQVSTGILNFLRKKNEREKYACLSIGVGGCRLRAPFQCEVAFIVAFVSFAFLKKLIANHVKSGLRNL